MYFCVCVFVSTPRLFGVVTTLESTVLLALPDLHLTYMPESAEIFVTKERHPILILRVFVQDRKLLDHSFYSIQSSRCLYLCLVSNLSDMQALRFCE